MKQLFLKYLLVVALCVCTASILFAGTAHAAPTQAANPAISCPGQTLGLGYVWNEGNVNYWTACSGRQLKLTFQSDNNFVLYCNSSAIWATGTNYTSGNYGYTEFQSGPNGPSGDLEVIANGWGQVWSSNTGNRGAAHMVLQGDGNLTIRTGSGAVLWASNTSGRC